MKNTRRGKIVYNRIQKYALSILLFIHKKTNNPKIRQRMQIKIRETNIKYFFYTYNRNIQYRNIIQTHQSNLKHLTCIYRHGNNITFRGLKICTIIDVKQYNKFVNKYLNLIIDERFYETKMNLSNTNDNIPTRFDGKIVINGERVNTNGIVTKTRDFIVLDLLIYDIDSSYFNIADHRYEHAINSVLYRNKGVFLVRDENDYFNLFKYKFCKTNEIKRVFGLQSKYICVNNMWYVDENRNDLIRRLGEHRNEICSLDPKKIYNYYHRGINTKKSEESFQCNGELIASKSYIHNIWTSSPGDLVYNNQTIPMFYSDLYRQHTDLMNSIYIDKIFKKIVQKTRNFGSSKRIEFFVAIINIVEEYKTKISHSDHRHEYYNSLIRDLVTKSEISKIRLQKNYQLIIVFIGVLTIVVTLLSTYA